MTKLYVSAVLLQLGYEGAIGPDDPMSNTSGITDYFFGKGPDGEAAASALFAGRFFPVAAIEELKQWNRIWFPGVFDFGVGLENQLIPWILSPFHPIGELLGFWGQSGAFAAMVRILRHSG